MIEPTSFSILNYRNVLEQRLSRLPGIRRQCFAVWCLHALVIHVSHALDATQTRFIEDSVTMLWRHVIVHTTPSMEQLSEIRKWCAAVEVNEDDMPHAALLMQLLGGMMTVVQLFANGEAKQSMLLADYVINCIDVELSERTGKSPAGNISTVPEIAEELIAQEAMLRYLESSPTLSNEDIYRFRPHEKPNGKKV